MKGCVHHVCPQDIHMSEQSSSKEQSWFFFILFIRIYSSIEIQFTYPPPKKKKKKKKRSTGIQFDEFRQFYIVIKPPLQLRYWWQDWGKRRILTNFWWKCKMAELLWTFWQILVLPICPGIVLLGIYQLIWKLMFK